MSADSKIHLSVLIIIVSYLLAAFPVVKDYGITYDEPENFATGHTYLNYYLTGRLDFSGDTPHIQGHPDFYNHLFKDFPYRYGSVANILSAVSCYVFFQRLHVLDPISAHHIIIPIITAFFLYFLFRFIRNYWGGFVGALSVAALITSPRFFGDTFNNIKDVPSLIFSSTSIMVFVNWYFSKKARKLYLAFLFFGLALATKIDTIFIGVILILWLGLSLIIDRSWGEILNRKTALHMIFGLLITIGVFVSFYPPLFPWQQGKAAFVSKMWGYWLQVGVSKDTHWNAYPPLQIAYTTAIPTLVLFLSGLLYIFLSRDGRKKENLLLLIWAAFPVFKYCLPGSINSDGIRRFLVFIVPLSIVASIGAKNILDKFAEAMEIKNSSAALFLYAIVLIPNVGTLISMHPYQNTYYNYLVGGLKGAQERNIPFSCDYWLNSFRKAGEWLEENAHTDAAYYAYPYPPLMKYYIKRQDLIFSSFGDAMPSNSYFVLVPRKWWPKIEYQDASKYLPNLSRCQIVYQIKRQGGIIVTIYHSP